MDKKSDTYQMRAFIFAPRKNEANSISYDCNGTIQTETFMNCALGNNIKEAYRAFEKHPDALLTYYLHHGEEATEIIISQARKQVGSIAATNMILTLEDLLRKRERSIQQLIRHVKAINAQAERDSRINPDTWHLTFDF